MKAFFLTHYAADPYFNMAVDEWLAFHASHNPGVIFFRLYSWSVGTITFGLNQRQEKALDFSTVGETPVIRRVTGGRAVYHDPSEITYAVAVDTAAVEPLQFGKSVSESSAVIAQALVRFLRAGGIDSHYARHASAIEAQPVYFHSAPCFNSVSRHEIVSNSHKIIASAQRRLGSVFLQHGAIKIKGIVSHPALPVVGRRNLCDPPGERLEEGEFRRWAVLFAREMGEFFRVKIQNYNLSGKELAQVEARKSAIEKKPFDKRDFFKQWLHFDSHSNSLKVKK